MFSVLLGACLRTWWLSYNSLCNIFKDGWAICQSGCTTVPTPGCPACPRRHTGEQCKRQRPRDLGAARGVTPHLAERVTLHKPLNLSDPFSLLQKVMTECSRRHPFSFAVPWAQTPALPVTSPWVSLFAGSGLEVQGVTVFVSSPRPKMNLSW